MSASADMVPRMLYTAATILAEYPDGLRLRELWPRIVEKLPGSAEETSAELPGSVPKAFSWASVGMVKAGFVSKGGGRWRLTPVGRQALNRCADPATFAREVDTGYQYWNRNKDRFERVQQLVEAIPEGSWISAPALAQHVGLADDGLLRWLQGQRPDGWHWVLDADGHLPASLGITEHDSEEWLGLLRDDGIDMTLGAADPELRLEPYEIPEPVPSPPTPEAPRRAWLIRGSSVLGENLIRTLWLPDGVCSVPATRLSSLPAGATAEQVRAAVDRDYAHASRLERAKLSARYHAFLSQMREQDLVMTNDGSEVFVGVLTSGPTFVASVENRANLQRTVDWRNRDRPLDYADDLPDEIATRLSNPDLDVIELTEFLDDLQRLIEPPSEPPPPPPLPLRLPDATGELADRLLVDVEWLQECVDLLRDRPQLIFFGPPGTGKTYLAQHLADHLAGGKPENVQLVQFHPAYTYEDFFEGYRPREGEGGQVGFELVSGPLHRLVSAAQAHPGEPYVLIIDEINRGNLAKIFGELYFLLEYRSKPINLMYGSDEGKGFTLPRNVIILGTMNTADRSIALVDAAMRRRFWFVELHPSEPPTRDMLARWLQDRDYTDEPARLLTELNERIKDRDFKIGPSYLMRPKVTDDAVLTRIWRHQILPLLEEHHYGDGTDVAATYGLEALRKRIAPAAPPPEAE